LLQTSQRQPASAAYAFYVVAVLLIAYILSFMDRTVMSLLIDPIRRDLGLTDTTIGLLIGFGFVIVYSTAGLFLGRLADAGNRRTLIMVGLIVWSAATAASSVAGSVLTLLFARLLVGVGEATLSPASYSLIASYFPRERLGIATSIYALGTVLGSGIASLLIGTVARLTAGASEVAGIPAGTGSWRLVFLFVGLIGLPFVLLLWTVREPRRNAVAESGPPVMRLSEAISHLRLHRRVYGGIMFGYAVMTIASYIAVLWAPTYFIRVHGYTPATVGPMFGLIMGVGGALGVLSGGAASDWLARRGLIDAPPRVALASMAFQMVLLVPAYLSDDKFTAVALFAAGIYVMCFQGGLQGASIQLLAPERMRAFSMALYLLTANLIGMGCGPVMVALLTDGVFHAPQAVGKSLAWVTLASSLAAIVVIVLTLPGYRSAVSARQRPAV
jgi:MFS family permease